MPDKPGGRNHPILWPLMFGGMLSLQLINFNEINKTEDVVYSIADSVGAPRRGGPPPPPPAQVSVKGELSSEFVGVYAAKVVSVIDGETVEADVYLPMGLMAKAIVKLIGVDAPEMTGTTKEKGTESRDYVRGLLLNKDVIVRSKKSDGFGKWLGDVWVDGTHANAAILKTGHAVPTKG